MTNNVHIAIDSYADDTTVTGPQKSVEEIETQLNNDCQKVYSWMKSNELNLNLEKTHILLMVTQKRLSSIQRPVEVLMDGVLLKEEASKC